MSTKLIETASKSDDESRKTLRDSPRSPSRIREGHGGTTNFDDSERASPARHVSHRSEEPPEIYERQARLKTEEAGAVIEYCVVCGRRLSWIRRYLRLVCCWRRECWQEFDETRS
jgi:hypothetical protein